MKQSIEHAVDPLATIDESEISRLPRTDLRFWKARLIQRNYGVHARRTVRREYSTRIQHEGVSYFFPLGSDDQSASAVRALEIYTALVERGWSFVCARYSREITVAVFWASSPLCCTYTTIYTLAGGLTKNHGEQGTPSKPAARVVLIEPDDGVRQALASWLDRQMGFRCELAAASIKPAVAGKKRNPGDLVLINRNLRSAQRALGNPDFAASLGVPVFDFGIYEESNYIFHSFTGVKAGYFLRRTPPPQLLEPISRLGREPRLAARAQAHEIRKYFHGLLELPSAVRGEDDFQNLTSREQEILRCLSRGWSDKQIADALNISVWTVHGHVKKVFEKLGVHSRTEAVIKYLQK